MSWIKESLRCKVCDHGHLEGKSVYRLSAPVVVIGYLLVTPSVCGIAFAAFLYLSALPQTHSNGDIAALAGVSAVIAGASLIGGLLGWLLIMKKRILKCSTCGAVTAAS